MDSLYCREIETYLCRKNEGHLIRIVGPVFEQVSGWAEQGVPLAVACRGIDRYCERYYAKGPRRRPVRVEFCEADVLDLFDDWRRAVGVSRRATHDGDPLADGRRGSLPAHLDRAIARLTALRAGERRSASFAAAIDDAVRELDARGPRRAAGARRRSGPRSSSGWRRSMLDLMAAVLEDMDGDSCMRCTRRPKPKSRRLRPHVGRRARRALRRHSSVWPATSSDLPVRATSSEPACSAKGSRSS